MKIKNGTPLGVWTVSSVALELSRQSDGTYSVNGFELNLHRVVKMLLEVEDELREHYQKTGEEQNE